MTIERPWISKITEVKKNLLSTYGIDQQQIIESFSYEEMVYFLIFGKLPSIIEKELLRAVIVSHCSHGITGQSTLAVRMAADCGSSFLNAAIGGFSVGSGTYHQGALELTMKLLQEAYKHGDIIKYLEERISSKSVIYGYGHRFHPRDPRAMRLMILCDEKSYSGPYIETAREIDNYMRAHRSKSMNIEAACGAILLEIGFPAEIASLIILVGRAPMFAAAYFERMNENERPFPRIKVYDVKPSLKHE
ncbi:MAG: hypothetical protein DBP02_07690 [gamma proteobacterium symbiont of Ctena orbiculata]|nr:MAG: hypothetical protein DBP02_07690 [gamma proteobacterium symbiont of Ctena orbiculata]